MNLLTGRARDRAKGRGSAYLGHADQLSPTSFLLDGPSVRLDGLILILYDRRLSTRTRDL